MDEGCIFLGWRDGAPTFICTYFTASIYLQRSDPPSRDVFYRNPPCPGLREAMDKWIKEAEHNDANDGDDGRHRPARSRDGRLGAA